MGWGWPFLSNNDTSARDGGSREEAQKNIVGAPDHTRSDARSRKEKEDTELEELIKSFSAPQSASPRSITAPTPAIGGVAPTIDQLQTQTQTQPTPEHETLSEGRRVFPDGTVDISPDAMHPRTMSCRQAFDQAFYCQSFGGKFNDVYRYGGLQSCNEQWDAFWFCMRTRTLPSAEKEGQVREYYKKRDERRRERFGSSEDVWQVRTKSVERAFWKDPDEAEEESRVKE